MNRLSLGDDFFSPVRFDASTIESSVNSEGSLSGVLNELSFSFSDTGKNESALDDYVMKSRRHAEIKSKDNVVPENSASVNTCTPISNKKSNKSLTTKKLSSNFKKLEKEKVIKNTLRKESSACIQVKQESVSLENSIDSCTSKSNSGLIDVKKSRPTSLLLSKDELVKCNALKNGKKGQKNISQSSKNSCNLDEMHKSNSELSSDRKFTDHSFDLTKHFTDMENSSVKSTESRLKTSPISGSLKKSNDASEQVESLELTSNPLHTQYEASIEKIIHDCISFESTKLRQNMYMQQMSFYREINKIKDEMEQQHVAVTERLFKIIEELLKMNSSLKSASVDKN